MIKEAKAKSLQVTCSVSVHHLVLNDEVLQGFDSRYNVYSEYKPGKKNHPISRHFFMLVSRAYQLACDSISQTKLFKKLQICSTNFHPVVIS